MEKNESQRSLHVSHSLPSQNQKNVKYIDYKADENKALIENENVIIMGRSIGTGPAIYLAAYSCFT